MAVYPTQTAWQGSRVQSYSSTDELDGTALLCCCLLCDTPQVTAFLLLPLSDLLKLYIFQGLTDLQLFLPCAW